LSQTAVGATRISKLTSAVLGDAIRTADEQTWLRAVVESREAESGTPGRGTMPMLLKLSRGFRVAASLIEAEGARHRVRRAPTVPRAAYDYIASFHYGEITAAPLQIKEEFLQAIELVAAQSPQTVLEIGTARGGTLFLLGRVAAESAHLVTVDLKGAAFGGGYPRTHLRFIQGLKRPRQRLTAIRGNSHAAETIVAVKQALAGRKVDVLFLDGDHTFEGVNSDFENYSLLVKNGGLILFHDIVPGAPEAVGSVPVFWKEVKKSHDEVEEIVESWEQGGYGIGVIRWKGPRTSVGT
jgi:cephalosporin hydroxylase